MNETRNCITDSSRIKIRNRRDSKKKVHSLLPTNPCESARFSSRDFFPRNENEFPEKVKWQVHVQNTDDITDSRRSMEAAERNEILFKGARFSKGEDICRYVRLRATSPRDELQRDRGREISVKLCPG